MGLSDQEKQKIYAEEKARLEAQEKLKKEKKSGCLLPGILIIIILMGLLAIFGPNRGSKNKGSDSVQMSPTVTYRGNLLVIKNNDWFGYDSAVVTINGTFKKELALSISPNEEATFELSDFTKSDGERFNIFRYSPTEISVSCESPGLGKLFYHGKFK